MYMQNRFRTTLELGCILALAAAGALGQQLPFFTAPVESAGYGPESVIAVDLNGDGYLDLAIGNQASANVTVRLGQGDGTFGPKRTYYVGGHATAIAAGDLNNDGAPDLVVGDILKGDTIAVLLNNGDGTFQNPTYVTVGDDPDGIAIGDFNADGNLDLAVSNLGSSTVSILLGKGNGTFQAPVNYTVGIFPEPPVTADLNGDGVLDLALTSGGDTEGYVMVMLGVGDGTFHPPVNYSIGSPLGQCNNIVVADFNGDHYPDLAVANVVNLTITGEVAVLLNEGDGTFREGVNYPVNGVTWWVAAGDINGDGIEDLVATGTGSAAVLLGNGDGTFQPGMNYAAGDSPLGIALGDFNRDGKLDVATANLGNGSDRGQVSLLFNRGGGRLRAPSITAADESPYRDAVGDFNNDGQPDVVVSNYVSNDVTLLLGRPDGVLRSAGNFAVGTGPVGVAVADFNGDGNLDVAVANSNQFADTGTVSVLFGNGTGVVRDQTIYNVGYDPQAIVTGDFNHDGKPDLAVSNCVSYSSLCTTGGQVSILLNQGNGTFAPPVNYSVGNDPLAIAAADLNRDGNLDLVTVNYQAGTASVLLGAGDGTFQAGATFNVNYFPLSVAIGDLNGDGIPDLAVGSASGDEVQVRLGNGNGTFGSPRNYMIGGAPEAIAIGDVNADGKADLVVAGDDHNLYVFDGVGNGRFSPIVPIDIGSVLSDVALVDLDHDGLLDAVGPNGAGVMILLNQTAQPGATARF
jgi:FG-GAP-like repeat/FG-GAP repeat